MNLDQAKTIYRISIDSHSLDAEGDHWWRAVMAELQAVVAARKLAEAASVISWWHGDWSIVSDTASAAAKRIRIAARSVL